MVFSSSLLHRRFTKETHGELEVMRNYLPFDGKNASYLDVARAETSNPRPGTAEQHEMWLQLPD